MSNVTSRKVGTHDARAYMLFQVSIFFHKASETININLNTFSVAKFFTV